MPERKAHFPRTDIKLFPDHLEPRGERTIQLAMLDQKEGYVGLRIPRGGGVGVMSAGLSRNEETEGDRRLQGMRSKEGKQRRNKGKTSEKCLIPETASSFLEERKCCRPQNQLQWRERRYGTR